MQNCVYQRCTNFLLYTTEILLPNDNVSMSVGHLDHVLLTVYNSVEHVLHRAVNSQRDVIKMFDGHRNVVIR